MNRSNDPYGRDDRDNESIYSTTSISSSIFSTSSRLSKIPSAVKSSFSSVKHLIRSSKKNRNSNNNNTHILPPFDLEASAGDNSSSGTRTKRQNPTAFLFSRRQTDNNSSVVTITQEQQQQQQQISSNDFTSGKKQPKRHGSVVNLANRLIRRDHNKSTIPNDQSYISRPSPSSPLTLPPLDLDGGNNDLSPVSDTKSERMPTKEQWQDQPWMRQRAKSCQENKTPLLRHLAQKNVPDLPESDSVPHKITNNESPALMDGLGGLPLFKGLVTATLTTLHTRLINECDRILALVLLPQQQQTGSLFPQDQLANIMAEVQKMTGMVKWDDESKVTSLYVGISRTKIMKQVDDVETSIEIAKLNYYNTNDSDALVVSLKEIVSKIKCIMNLCICQYYKVAEEAIAIPSKGYRIEGKNKYSQLREQEDKKDSLVQHSNSHSDDSCHDTNYSLAKIDHKDEEACWYRNYFQSQETTCTFFGYNDEGEPLLISAVAEVENQKKQYRLIHRTKKLPDTRKLVMDSFLLNAPDTPDELEELVPETTWKTVIETNLEMPFNKLKQMPNDMLKSSGIQDELLKLDENSLHTKYKFGVLLIKEGQTKEEEWFANQHDSNAFDQFLNIIGTPVELKGYSGWAAGLDTKSGDSGEYTFTSTWNENILAYHVAPLIPSKQGDKQQIQRKRHIGNDIVCIVFVQGNQPFNPSAIKSQFLHVFIIVHQETYKEKTAWSVEIVTVEDVPAFGPPLPENGIFYDEKELSEFILAKLVNAEYAAFKSPKFSMPNARAREGIFSGIVERGLKMIDDHSETTYRKHCKTPSTSSSHSSRSLRLNHSQKSSDSITPSPSKSSSAIKELSENLVSLGRRRSIQDLNEKTKTKTKNRKQKSGISKRSRSELDLIDIAKSGKQKDGIKHRAQNILTVIPRFGRRSSLPHPETSVSTPAFPKGGNSP